MRFRKNSKEYDKRLLEKMKKLKDVPVEKFDSLVEKILKKKSKKDLWVSYRRGYEWDGIQMRETNYRCCSGVGNVKNVFCLVLNENSENITVEDGFLSEVW